jgi:glutathione S-transferase
LVVVTDSVHAGANARVNVALRYFDCRGRAEPLRHLLRDRGVAFEDAREPIDDVRRTIARLDAEPALAAPFGLLPVLDWDGFRVAQTLAIASFVSRELGAYAALDGRAVARVESLASAAYCELTCVLPEIVWSPLWCAGLPFERLLKRVARTPCTYPRKLESVLQAGEPWFCGADPLAADFFVFEGLAAWQAILGEPYVLAIAQLPKLSAWWARASERVQTKTFERARFTASPFEVELFARAREHTSVHGLPWPV